MPDADWQSVSASQAAALFNQSPYITRWMLWWAFKKRDRSLIAPAGNERIAWGKLLQDDILYATSLAYRLEVEQNINDQYVQNGVLGATIDGLMRMPDRGPVVVEAKAIDWLRWKETWSETAAAVHVEIQLQVQMLAAGTDHGIIAALIGGNEIRWLERERNGDLVDRLREEAAAFFASLDANEEPDPLGSPLELPMLAELYPTADPLKVIEDLDDDELAIAVRQFRWARDEETFARKLKEQMQAKILARAGGAGQLVVNGARCKISKIPVAPTLCEPHTAPRVIRKASTMTKIKVQLAQPVAPLDDDLETGDIVA
jgi:predicted phage-related endonuclease